MFEFKAVCISISHMEEGDIRVLQVNIALMLDESFLD